MITNMLESLLQKIVHHLGYEVPIHVIVSNRKELCDYQCDDSFKIAKQYHKSPMMIGGEIVEKLKEESSYFKEVCVVAPGFINMTLSDSLINKMLNQMMIEEKFGLPKPKQIDTYMIDYGGANIAKPLHVGHLRPAIVGESIKRIIAYMGHQVIGDVHLGDYGLQIGQVIYGIKRDHMAAEDITLSYLEKIYPEMSALCKQEEEIKSECAEITKQLQEGNTEYQELFHKIRKISGDDCRRVYEYLQVHFDLWLGESDAYPYIEPVTQLLSPYMKESEGAKIIEVSEPTDSKELPPLIYQKSNGAYLYATTDLATIYQRMKEYHPQYILYVVDSRQSLHFEQVFRVCQKSGLTKDTKLEFLGFGTINGVDGKPFKTRNGDTPKLDQLFEQIKGIFLEKKENNKDMPEEDLDKIVNAILKFADLQNNLERDYIFDLDKFSNVVGKTGPYMLYTYLRIHKILGQETYEKHISGHIYNEDDRKLRLKLLELNEVVQTAFEGRMPSVIADYVYQLALLTNTFYQNNHIQGLENQEQKNDWLSLLDLTSQVLKEMLNLLIIDIPNFM